MMKLIRSSIIMISVLLSGGCSFLSPVQSGPDIGYMINTVPQHVAKSRQHNITLLVMRPDTEPAYNNDRIAFTQREYQISYYSLNHWAETPADMLMPLIAETLQKTHHFRAVTTPPYAGAYDFALRSEIRELKVDYARHIPELKFHLFATILRANTGNVVATHEFTITVPLQHPTPYSAVVAANTAVAEALQQMAAWSIRHTHQN